jgi:hypothetical protein
LFISAGCHTGIDKGVLTMSEVTSHSNDADEQKGLSDDQLAEIMQSFGYNSKTAEKTAETPENEQDEQDDEDDNPAMDDQPKNVRKVRFNKKDVEIEEDKIDEYIQKGLALDKERERREKSEKALERSAKAAGYDSVDAYIADLDNIEAKATQRKQDQFKELKQKLRDEAEENGIDPDLLEKFLDEHPLLQQANEVLSKQEQEREASKAKEAEQAQVKAWEQLFSKYPDLHEQMSEDGASAPWMTDDFINRINRGYDPIDAYELLNKDSIREKERELTRQQVLKQNRLNKRAKVEGNVAAQSEEEVPDNIKGAFKQMGLDPRTAKKFM